MISTAEKVCRSSSKAAGNLSPSSKRNGRKAVVSVADLCCGMGGLSLAAKQLGLKVVVGVDLNASALKTFGRNFPEAEAIEGSVRSEKVLKRCEELLKLDNGASKPSIVLSGPPCQGFSVAGSRDPGDPRNQVLVAVARAIARLQPTCALIENVSTVLAESHRPRLHKFEGILAGGGFSVASVLLDASEFGVPQKRKRAFFLVTRSKLDEQEIIKQLEQHKVPAGNARRALAGLPKAKVRPEDFDDETDYGVIANHLAMQHARRVMRKIAAIEPGTGPLSYRRLHPKYPSNTLISGHRAPPAHFKEPRSITVREAARLQGFPDDFRVFGSFGKQMEQVTNAVPPPLAHVVLRVLLALAGIGS